MNGYSNSATWCVAIIVNNDEALFNKVHAGLGELGTDLALWLDSEDDDTFQDWFAPRLAEKYEETVRDFDGWLRSNEIATEFNEVVLSDSVNWAELATSFVEDNFKKVGA